MKRNAFTLIELMIVVAVIGVLVAIAIPNFIRFHERIHGRSGSCFKVTANGITKIYSRTSGPYYQGGCVRFDRMSYCNNATVEELTPEECDHYVESP
jgi:prepilin-type N-terminal cleavage/methylation domain-containing protein